MRLTMSIYAGQAERFASDLKLPESGQEMQVTLPDGTKATGRLVNAERVDGERFRITVDVPEADDSP